jgi:hypothetical protein
LRLTGNHGKQNLPFQQTIKLFSSCKLQPMQGQVQAVRIDLGAEFPLARPDEIIRVKAMQEVL